MAHICHEHYCESFNIMSSTLYIIAFLIMYGGLSTILASDAKEYIMYVVFKIQNNLCLLKVNITFNVHNFLF